MKKIKSGELHSKLWFCKEFDSLGHYRVPNISWHHTVRSAKKAARKKVNKAIRLFSEGSAQ
jgi:hypothetical protein